MIPVDAYLRRDAREPQDAVPYVTLVDGERRPAARHRRRPPDARRAALPRVVAQPAGTGRHPQFARGKAARARAQGPGGTGAAGGRGAGAAAAPAAHGRRARAGAPPRRPSEKKSPDEAYIETARCTTCNECTQINDKMFAYNENKQAYIANPDAGHLRAAGGSGGELPGLDHPSRQAAQSGRARDCRPSQARRGLRLARPARPRFSPPPRRRGAASRVRRPRSPDCRPWCWQSRIAG